MLAEERFQKIIQLVEEKGAVTVQELTELLATSESTIRRDLTVLHDSGKLIKVHGGATAASSRYSTKDDSVEERREKHREEKLRIARYAASMIRRDDFVYLDAGTTTDWMIDFITERDAVFVTGAAGHARKLSQKGCSVFLLGGQFKPSTETVVGAETLIALQKYNFTKGFFGTNGVSAQMGYSTPDANEAMVKRQAVLQCKERFVLSDISKFGKVSSVTFAAFSDAVVITTRLEDKSFRNCTNILEVDTMKQD